jgi:hypothetical protein
VTARARARARRGGDDSGFTLIEVVMTVGLTAAIIGVLAGAVIVTMGPDQRTAEGLASSHAVQHASIWVPADLESAGPVDTAADLRPGADPACTGAIAGVNVLRLAWSQPAPVVTSFAVSYRVLQRQGDWQLLRVACTDGGPARELVVARGLVDGSTARAAVDGRRITVSFTTTFGDDVAITGVRRTPDGGGVPTSSTTTTLPPVTTTSPTTTPPTTTPPTTTTTAAPASCAVTSVTASPSSINRRNSDWHLVGSVSVEVRATGPCSGLRLRYVPLTSLLGPTTRDLAGGPGVWTTTIPGSNASGAEAWSTGDHMLRVLGATGSATFATTGELEVS